MRNQQSGAQAAAPAFYSVAATAQMLGASEMTVYRAIQAGEFPALRIRGRIVVPAKALEALTEAAVEGRRLVDVAEWTAAAAGGGPDERG
jgi:excisionase family DNA binding protein